MNDITRTSKDVSIYDIDAPLELSDVKKRDERDFPDTLMRYTNPWAICAMQDRHWLIERVEHLRNLLWRIQPILNPGSEIAYKVEHEVGSVHTNREGPYSTHEPAPEQPSPTEIIRQMRGRAAASDAGGTVEVLLSDLRSVVAGMLTRASQPPSVMTFEEDREEYARVRGLSDESIVRECIESPLRVVRELANRYDVVCEKLEKAEPNNVTRLPARNSYIAPLSDRADELIRELKRQGMVKMQAVFDGMLLRIEPDAGASVTKESAPVPNPCVFRTGCVNGQRCVDAGHCTHGADLLAHIKGSAQGERDE